MHFSRALEYKLQPVSSEHLVMLCVAAHSSRCLRHTALREWHHKDAGIQCRGKPRVQPQSHLLQEIPRHTHLCRGLTHSYHLYNVHYICRLTVCSHSQCVCVAVRRYGAEVCCGTRCSARLDSRRQSPRGVGATWLICEAADPVQDADGASTSRRPPAFVSQTCDTSCHGNRRPLRWTLMSKQVWWTKKQTCPGQFQKLKQHGCCSYIYKITKTMLSQCSDSLE